MTDEHAMHHVNYLAVFIALCILTGMSVIFDVVEMRGKTIFGIFNGTILLIFLVLGVAVAKALADAAKDKDSPFVILSGSMEGKAIDVAGITQLSKLPDRQTLLSMFLSGISGPLQNFVNVLAATPRDFANVLTQVKEQKEKQG